MNTEDEEEPPLLVDIQGAEDGLPGEQKPIKVPITIVTGPFIKSCHECI